MSDSNIEILQKETLIALIENSVGSKTFNSLFVRLKREGKIKDILENGEYSCAFFVSSLLYFTDMINKPRATVKSTELFLHESPDWEKVDFENREVGDVVVWEKQIFPSGEEHAHIGFVSDQNMAVSTDFTKKCVSKHGIDSGGRKITAIYRYID